MDGYPEDDGCIAEVGGDVQSSVAGKHNVSSSLLFLVPFARASLHERDRVVAVWKLRGSSWSRATTHLPPPPPLSSSPLADITFFFIVGMRSGGGSDNLPTKRLLVV
jgi:hypothetical protein